MTQVDIDDDSITRYVVWHYRFDSETCHFKRIPVAAFSTSREAKRLFNQESDQLRKRKESGVADDREYVSLDQMTAGHKIRAREIRMLLRWFRPK